MNISVADCINQAQYDIVGERILGLRRQFAYLRIQDKSKESIKKKSFRVARNVDFLNGRLLARQRYNAELGVMS